MNWGRKGALLMLAVVALWTATPAFACLLTIEPAGQPACCRGMVQDCPMQGMGMNASCCQMRGSSDAVAPELPYSPEYAHQIAFALRETSLETSAGSGAGWRYALEVPPPKSSPGAIFILRI